MNQTRQAFNVTQANGRGDGSTANHGAPGYYASSSPYGGGGGVGVGGGGGGGSPSDPYQQTSS